MSRLPGQVMRGCWVVLHRVFALLLPLLVIVVAGAAVLAWRLSQGPIDLPWLAARITAAANRQLAPGRVAIGSAALTWEGFRHGLESPIDIRLTDVWLFDDLGAREFDAPHAGATLSLSGLISGRIVPATLEIDRPTIVLQRASDGAISLHPEAGAASPDRPDAGAVLRELTRPSTEKSGVLGDLVRFRLRGATVRVVDRQLGANWQIEDADLDLARAAQGSVSGQARLTLALATQKALLTVSLQSSPNTGETRIEARLGPITPAALATASPALAWLSTLDAAVTTEAEAKLGPGPTVQVTRLTLQAEAGKVRVASSTVPILSASLLASGASDHVTVQALRLVLPATNGLSPTTVEAHGTMGRAASGAFAGKVALTLDHVAFADLPLLWPAGLASDARDWVVQNITSGLARDGRFEVGLVAASDLAGLRITQAKGTLQGDGVTVHWLRPVPPIVQAEAELRVTDPNMMEVHVTSGVQAPGTPAGQSLAVDDLQMQISGLEQKEQSGSITVAVAGPLPAAIALLQDKRLGLLSRHPLPLKDPSGQVTTTLSVSLPLIKTVDIDQVAISAQAHLSDVHLADIVAGHGIDQGVCDLKANNDGLSAAGQAMLAGIAAQFQANMDFTAGPPSQAAQRIALTMRPDARQLAALGIDSDGVVAGPMSLQTILTERRDGTGQVRATADLSPTTLAIDALGWRKPAGTPAQASATLMLDHDRLTAIDPIRVEGDGLEVVGNAEVTQGRLTAVQANRLVLGRTVAQARVQFPASGPIAATVSGPTLDLSARFGSGGGAHRARQARHMPERRGQAWGADARFDRVLLSGGSLLTQVSARIADDGLVVRDLRLAGSLGSAGPLRATIEPGRDGRIVRVAAGDAGALLRAFNLLDTMEGGRLGFSGVYRDSEPGRPLVGTTEIDDFRVRNAPVMGKLLQAVTLYGLVQALRGPGVGFTKLIAPFRLDDGVLELTGARAYSPSLGLTAKGSIDLDSNRIDVAGTIVPAYFFNSLLGRMPVIGRLFSPERGGGVISAAYTLRGPLDDPAVGINPLTALTPGFLRGLFGSF